MMAHKTKSGDIFNFNIPQLRNRKIIIKPRDLDSEMEEDGESHVEMEEDSDESL